MENPRPEKVAVVDEVRERFDRRRRRAAHRVPRARRDGDRRAAPRAARRRRRVQDLQEHPGALRRPRPGADELDDAAHRPDGHRLRPTATPAARGQGAARLRPDQPGPGGQGRPARRQGRSTADDVKALADLAPREVLLAQLAGAFAAPLVQVRRPAPGPAPQLRLRPQGPHRPAGRRPAAPPPSPSRARGRGPPRPRPPRRRARRHRGRGRPPRRRRRDRRRPPPKPPPTTTRHEPTDDPRRADPWPPRKRSSTPSPT